MQKCLFDTYSNNTVAYCKHHRCNITTKQMKCKGCLGKECFYLIKNLDHPYWIQREVMKQKRKNRKEKINESAIRFQK